MTQAPATPDAPAAMLFSPPLPPLRLGTGAPVAIGRHPSCELALRRDDVSRRHAEIRFEDGGYVLCDLGSTNGTYVNGRVVEGTHRLEPGDRIEVGSGTVTYCVIDGARAGTQGPHDEALTLIAERAPDQTNSQMFAGDLAQVPACALFQLMEMGSNSGLLEIESDDGHASVWFAMGRPTHARSDKQLGFDAAIEIVRLDRGRFRFGPCNHTPDATINASVTELLLESCRLQDEEAAAEI